MRWIAVTDYGGIGDVLATAVVLSAFRNGPEPILFNTRLWDCQGLLSCLWPSWQYLSLADPHNPPTGDPIAKHLIENSIAHVKLTPLVRSSTNNFYRTRLEQIEQQTGLTAGDIWFARPFMIADMPTAKPIGKYAVIHANAAWDGKSIPSEQVRMACDLFSRAGLVPLVVGTGDQAASHGAGIPISDLPLQELVSLINSASAVVCCDSCVSHIAYWLGVPLHVVYRDTDADFLLASMANPPRTSYELKEEHVRALL